MLRIGVFADKYLAATGFARVCNALATELSKKYKVYYFGRFGAEEYKQPLKAGFLKMPLQTDTSFLYVPCVGGVWDETVCVNAINHYKLDAVFSEDDWFSAEGIAEATNKCNVPFHFLTPIDSLPIHPNSRKVFKHCNTIYVPNSAYKILEMKGYNSVYLPHGVDKVFKPLNKKPEGFHFLLMGRNEDRKAIGRALVAYKKIYKKIDARMIIHTDWTVPSSKQMKTYINLSFENVENYFAFSQMRNNPHLTMNMLYNLADVNICTAKAGGFEMGVTEAAGAQVPSIVTNWTFMNENIEDGKTGWLVPYSTLISERQFGRMWANIDIDSLAERMKWCYENQAEVELAGIQARMFVTERFKWHVIGNTLRKNIEKSVKQ